MGPTLGGGTQDTDFNKGFTKGMVIELPYTYIYIYIYCVWGGGNNRKHSFSKFLIKIYILYTPHLGWGPFSENP